MLGDRIEEKAAALVRLAAGRRLRLTTAESCTGGGVAAAICAMPGASDMFDQGVIVYADAAKTRLLGVDAALIERRGAVSSEVAAAMAAGALTSSGADLAIAVTGIAGPGGGSAEKPVGLVWFGLASAAGARQIQQRFEGDRARVQAAATEYGLGLLLEALDAL